MASSSATVAILLLLASAMTLAPRTASAIFMDDNFMECWEAISELQGCIPEVVFPKPGSVQLNMKPECCEAANEIKEKCFSRYYPDFLTVVPEAASLLQVICSDHSSPAPQPAAMAS